MKKHSGFTLIEVLIALTIFAFLAGMTASSLYYSFHTKSLVDQRLNQIDDLQNAISLMRQDTLQMVARPIVSTDMHTFPAFIGRSMYLEFTRDGFLNPGSVEKRSTLRRVALLCDHHQLIRRIWASVDMPDRELYEDRVLFSALSQCQLQYFNFASQLLSEWRPQITEGSQELLPKAIQVNITLAQWGNVILLFPIPGAMYAAS